MPFDAIRFVQGDTDQVPFGRGTYAARSSMLGGCALRNAADAVIEKAKPMAAALMEAAAHDVEKEGTQSPARNGRREDATTAGEGGASAV